MGEHSAEDLTAGPLVDDQDDPTRQLLGASSLAIAAQLQKTYPDAARYTEEVLATALFVLADAGIVGFVADEAEELAEVNLIGLQLLPAEASER